MFYLYFNKNHIRSNEKIAEKAGYVFLIVASCSVTESAMEMSWVGE
jgi:hypothetical protein